MMIIAAGSVIKQSARDIFASFLRSHYDCLPSLFSSCRLLELLPIAVWCVIAVHFDRR